MNDDEKQMDARTAFATALSEELDRDLTPELMTATDKMLMRLFMFGYIVSPTPDKTETV